MNYKQLAELISNLPVDFLVVILLALAFISGLISFADTNFLTSIGLYEFKLQYRVWISLTFLVSSVLSLLLLVNTIFRTIRKRANASNSQKYHQREQIKLIENLSLEEQGILFQYLIFNTKTRHFNILDGVIAGLESKGLIYLATQTGSFRSRAFNIADWLWVLLKESPDKVFSGEFLELANQEIIKLAQEAGLHEDEIYKLLTELREGTKIN